MAPNILHVELKCIRQMFCCPWSPHENHHQPIKKKKTRILHAFPALPPPTHHSLRPSHHQISIIVYSSLAFHIRSSIKQLKPTASIDYPPVRPQRSGSLINAPNERTIREVPTGTLCLLDDAEEANEQSFESACSSMSFDSPPEASPPVPPRTNNPPPSQFGTSATSSSASSLSLGRGTQSIITPPPRPLPPSKKSSIDHSAINTMTFENNFVNNDAFSIANNRARAAPLPIPPAATMSTVSATTASFPNRLCAEVCGLFVVCFFFCFCVQLFLYIFFKITDFCCFRYFLLFWYWNFYAAI